MHQRIERDLHALITAGDQLAGEPVCWIQREGEGNVRKSDSESVRITVNEEE